MTHPFENLDATIVRLDLKDRYSDLRVLGEGGMGKVFLAHDKKMEKQVAIKLLHSNVDVKSIVRFQTEARALSKLNHQFIVKVLDFQYTEGGELFLVMEFVDGESVESIIEKNGPLPAKDALKYAIQLCDALEHAHANSVVHRDLKPSNIIIDREKKVRILDFGIAKLLTQYDPFGTLTKAGQPLGSPMYMSPEQVQGEDADERTDIYGLGLMLYTMMAGKPPFDTEQLFSGSKQENLSPPSVKPYVEDAEFADGLDKIIQVALRSDPDQRFPSMTEFRAALEELASEEDLQAITVQQVVRRPISWKSILISTVLVIAGCCAFASLMLFHWSATHEDATTSGAAKNPTELKHAKGHHSKIKQAKKPAMPPGFVHKDIDVETANFWHAEPTVTDNMLDPLLKTKVKQLSFEGNELITDKGIEKISSLPIVALHLSRTKLGDSALPYVAKISTLRWLRLSTTAVTDKGIKHLAPVRHLQRLELDHCTGFTDVGLAYVAKQFPELKSFHIGETSVTPNGARISLAKLKELRSLWLPGLDVTDDDIAPLKGWGITWLDLSFTKITDKSINTIVSMKDLHHVEVSGCTVTNEGLYKLRKLRRDLVIVRALKEDILDPSAQELYKELSADEPK